MAIEHRRPPSVAVEIGRLLLEAMVSIQKQETDDGAKVDGQTPSPVRDADQDGQRQNRIGAQLGQGGKSG